MAKETNCPHDRKHLGGCEECLALAYEKGDKLEAENKRLKEVLKEAQSTVVGTADYWRREGEEGIARDTSELAVRMGRAIAGE